MDPNTEEIDNGNGKCGSATMVQPCACCAALAQLRMPWMDAAVQHAAPHYPQYYAPGTQQPAYSAHQAYTSAPYYQKHNATEEDDDVGESEEEEERKTLFFKFPSGNKPHKDKGKKTVGGRKPPPAQRKKAEKKTEDSGGSARKSQTSAATEPAKPGEAEPSDADASFGSPEHEADSTADAVVDNAAAFVKPKFRLAFGLQGLAVGLFGIFMPAFILGTTIFSAPKRITLVSLHHPVETTVELLLLAALPVVNYLVWSAICKNRLNLSRWLTMGLGSSIGAALIASGFSFAGLFGNNEGLADAIGTDFTMGFAWLGILGLLSACTSIFLANRLRLSWELQSSRLKVSAQICTGIIVALLAFAGAEFRPWCIRLAQFNAVATDEATRKEGLRWLRQLNPEREMRMECSDSRAAGVPGLFFPIKPAAQQQLYFTLTGTPYSFRDEKATDLASMSDDYLSRHVVGDKIPHLDLTRSSLNGTMHANTLTSTLNWTFVVKNGTSLPQEMRAEIGLPSGAAVTGLTVWKKGEATKADIVSSGKIEGQATTAGGDTPGMVTDLGHGRVLVHCYPVPHDEEMKVMLNMVVPLKSETAGEASLTTPQLIASNFSLDGEHSLRLRSKNVMVKGAKGLDVSTIPGGENIISGTLTNEQLETSPVQITAKRAFANKPFAVLDKIATLQHTEDAKQRERIRVEKEREKERKRVEQANTKDTNDIGQVVLMIDGSKGVDLNKILAKKKHVEKARTITPRVIKIEPQYVVEDIQRVAAPAPKHLVVVIDGSNTMKQYGKELKEAFASLPKNIPTSVIIASQESDKKIKTQALTDVLPQIEKLDFVGGQDNLKAVVRASELAGEAPGGAVLWIHGPQPVLNQEIYIMSPYESTPAFYELPVVAGTDTFEFFKNHNEVGPFTQVPRNGKSVQDDLSIFFSKWNSNNNAVVATLAKSDKVPAGAIAPSKDEAREMLVLRAVEECNRLVSTRYFRRAARLALAYGFVSPVSSAILSNSTAPVVDADNLQQPQSEEAKAPTITPESTRGGDEFCIDGNGGSQTAQQTESIAPQLQGATNGTIGPQGGDATVIMGVNTAGTVRVNNLANLEALLNIVANLGELIGAIGGFALIVHGLMNRAIVKLGEDVELGPAGRVFLGAILLALGVCLPGMINWFVASARDANLFS